MFCSRRQTHTAKQIPEALFRANRIKHRIHGEIRHPDSTITIGSFKPLVRLLFYHSDLAARLAAHNQGDIEEELHAMDYLVYAYLQEDREREANEVIQQLKATSNWMWATSKSRMLRQRSRSAMQSKDGSGPKLRASCHPAERHLT